MKNHGATAKVVGVTVVVVLCWLVGGEDVTTVEVVAGRDVGEVIGIGLVDDEGKAPMVVVVGFVARGSEEAVAQEAISIAKTRIVTS